MAGKRFTEICRLLRAGGKTARQIAEWVPCHSTYVYQVARCIGVKPVPADPDDPRWTPPTFKPRPVHLIRADLAAQLEEIEMRFHDQLCRDRQRERMF